jgi:hypothetical protein
LIKQDQADFGSLGSGRRSRCKSRLQGCQGNRTARRPFCPRDDRAIAVKDGLDTVFGPDREFAAVRGLAQLLADAIAAARCENRRSTGLGLPVPIELTPILAALAPGNRSFYIDPNGPNIVCFAGTNTSVNYGIRPSVSRGGSVKDPISGHNLSVASFALPVDFLLPRASADLAMFWRLAHGHPWPSPGSALVVPIRVDADLNFLP